jgi:AraC family transcriptional regulator, activator of mtrCDE
MMVDRIDWLSRLLEMIPVSGRLDLRCFLAAPWRIEYEQSQPGEIPYHVVLGGSVVLEVPVGGPPWKLVAGDIVLLMDGAPHALHDGNGTPALPLRERATLNLTISENEGTGERLDMLCGRFVLSPAHERMLRVYFPRRVVVRAAENSAATSQPGTSAQVARLVSLMRSESAVENLGGLAMLNALSTGLFTLALRLASEANKMPAGLLALASNPRLSPALTALFNEPARSWTLPELARLCNMSRATFIRHFQERLGRSASDLLIDIRMTVASNALKSSDTSAAAVAKLVGYQSEAAFQRAFKQRLGITPAQGRRKASSGDSAQARRVSTRPGGGVGVRAQNA